MKAQTRGARGRSAIPEVELEPISYLRAPIRRWPVVVSVALVAMIVALLVPVGSDSAYPANTWKAPAQMGLNPPYGSNGLGAKVSVKQVEFYAQAPAVMAAAAKADGIAFTNQLRSDVMLAKVKIPGVHGSILEVSVLQPTKHEAASLTNAFVAALASYTQVQLVKQHANAIAKQQAYIANLEKAIAGLPKVKAPPTTTTTTTLPTVKVKTKKTKKAERVSTRSLHGTHPGTASTSVASATALTLSVSPRIELVDTATTAITTPPTTPATIPATSPPTGGTGTGATTTIPLNNRTIVDENHVLATALGGAIAGLGKLDAEGVAPSGIRVIAPSSPKHAVKLNPNPPLLSNAFLRAFLGLVIGVLLGVVATWLLDAFDRRLRTSKRAEEVFGLPVIVEIPATDAKSVSTIPIVDVIVDPYSPASEAYRRLHVAILTAPPVTWVKRGYGYQEDLLELTPLRPPQEILIGAPARVGTAQAPGGPGGVPNDAVTGRLPVPLGSRSLRAPHRARFSILVTAPTDEPTRSLVVVNLAAVFAEAGDRVLVATTGGMRSGIVSNGMLSPTGDGPYSELTASEIVANARPSQIPGVSSLALGQLFPNPSKLALNARALVEAARDVVDVILWEAPLLSTQDGTALLPAADLVVVIAEAWHTTVRNGLQSQRLLAQHRPPVLGLVMTNMRADHPSLSAAP